MMLFAPSVKATAPGGLEQADLGHLLALRGPWSARPSAGRARSRCRARGAATKSTIAGSSITRVGVGLADDGGDAAGRGGLARRSPASRDARRPARRRRRACRPGRARRGGRGSRRSRCPSGTPAARMPRLASRITPSAISRSPECRGRATDRRSGRWRARIGRRSDSHRSGVGQVARQRFEHRHAHGDAHLDLLADQRLRAVGDRGGRSRRRGSSGLDASPARRAWRRRASSGRGRSSAKYSCVEGTNEPFMRSRCSAQHHDDVGAVEPVAHVARDLDAEALDAGRQQRRGRDHAHARAERVEQDDVRARHARSAGCRRRSRR